jgi:NADH-quinone oxidoreductase subunit J
MEITLQEIVFYVVAAAIAVFSVLAVTTGKILRAATYLLFVLFGTGAIYGVLGYTFLGAVQLMVYAGCIVVLYVFTDKLATVYRIFHILVRLSQQDREYI